MRLAKISQSHIAAWVAGVVFAVNDDFGCLEELGGCGPVAAFVAGDGEGLREVASVVY